MYITMELKKSALFALNQNESENSMNKETNYRIILDIWNITKRLYDNPTFSDEEWEQLNNNLQDLNKKYDMQPYIRDLTLATVNEFERQQERRKIDNRV